MPTVGLELTNRCPWRCETCLPASGLSRQGEMDPERLLYLLDLLAGHGYDAVCFSGGEPLIHPEIAALLARASALGLRTSLFTSGSGLDRTVLDAVLGAGTEVIVSLDGGDAALHDLTRGTGSFQVATTALDRLLGAGARASVSCTVTLRNLRSLDALVERMAALGIHRLTFSEVVRGGRARSNWSELGLGVAERDELRRWFLSASPTWPGGAGSDSVTDDACWVDGTSLYVNSQGRCYTCSEVAQFGPRNLCGRITGDPDADGDTMRRARSVDLHGCACRYDMIDHGPYLLVLDSPRPCVGLDHLVPEAQPALAGRIGGG
jgi:MoaA/NifB/PqqE/SkfB family radical SAM enzyme